MITLSYERLDFGDESNIDIKDDAYNKLIDICCKYSYCFSFTIFENEYPEIQPYRWKSVTEDDCYKPGQHYKTCFYQITHKSIEFLKKPPHSLFYWTGAWLTPENLCFYRLDGSILLQTIAHDQNCFVYLGEENINDFLHLAPWKITNIEPWPKSIYF